MNQPKRKAAWPIQYRVKTCHCFRLNFPVHSHTVLPQEATLLQVQNSLKQTNNELNIVSGVFTLFCKSRTQSSSLQSLLHCGGIHSDHEHKFRSIDSSDEKILIRCTCNTQIPSKNSQFFHEIYFPD